MKKQNQRQSKVDICKSITEKIAKLRAIIQNIFKFHFRDLLFKAKQVERSGRTVKTTKRLIKCEKKHY